ncbi:MAG: pilus assembly protein PilM [Chitinispirillaceae bacterium]|nr:pilus assembly protein PilM [Chitinispirillaceae bacterium]
MPKGAASVGIEIDSQSIRGAKIRPGKIGKAGGPLIAGLEELSGPFVKDAEIIDGLRTLRQKMSMSFADTLVTCVGGKQTYAAQLFFRKLPDEEMKTALKFEIRKNLSFDTAGSTVEYQILSAPAKKTDSVPVIVTSVANVLLQRHLRLFEKAGLPPFVIDVFPLTVANAFRAGRSGAESAERGAVILHIGPDFSTVVIEGNGTVIPFYNRTIYFSAAEIFDAGGKEPPAPREIERRINAFTGEISRSLAYYQNTYHTVTDTSITVLGGYALPKLLEKIVHDTGLAINRLDLVNEFDARQTAPAGKFDIAVALGMRGREL